MKTYHLAATSALSLMLLTSLAPGQRTWIVDDDGGPGVDFLDLPPAVAAAAPGDRILIRAGAYASTTIDKPLRVVGEPGTYIVGFPGALLVRGIPAGAHCEIVGLGFLLANVGVTVRNCAGVVVLRDLPTSAISAAIEDCAYVALSGRFAQVTATRSTLVISSATNEPPNYQTALTLTDCRTTITASVISGGVAASGNPFAPGPGSGIAATRGSLRIAGDCSVAAGISYNPLRAPALYAVDCDMTIDPAATFSSQSTPILATGIQPRFATVPSVSATPGAGATVIATLRAAPQVPAIIAASAAADPTLTPFGLFVLDAASAVTVIAGTTSPQRLLTTSIPVPTDPALRGTPVHFQGVALTTTIELTTPASYVVR